MIGATIPASISTLVQLRRLRPEQFFGYNTMDPDLPGDEESVGSCLEGEDTEEHFFEPPTMEVEDTQNDKVKQDKENSFFETLMMEVEDTKQDKVKLRPSAGTMMEIGEEAGFYKFLTVEVGDAEDNRVKVKSSAGTMVEIVKVASFHESLQTGEEARFYKSSIAEENENEEVKASEPEFGSNDYGFKSLECVDNLNDWNCPVLVDIPEQWRRYDQGWMGPFEKT